MADSLNLAGENTFTTLYKNYSKSIINCRELNNWNKEVFLVYYYIELNISLLLKTSWIKNKNMGL